MLGWSRHGYSEDMHHEDPYQNLYIDFKKGPTHLDGDRALELFATEATLTPISEDQVQELPEGSNQESSEPFGHNQNTGPV